MVKNRQSTMWADAYGGSQADGFAAEQFIRISGTISWRPARTMEPKPGPDGVKTLSHKDGTPYPKHERTWARGPSSIGPRTGAVVAVGTNQACEVVRP